MKSWPYDVPMKVARDTTWELPTGTVADETRSGRRKVRPANFLQPDTFAVSITVDYDKYIVLRNWFRNDLRKGALSFGYPRVDEIGGGIVEYRFVPGTSISCSNPKGKKVKLSMQWEEV